MDAQLDEVVTYFHRGAKTLRVHIPVSRDLVLTDAVCRVIGEDIASALAVLAADEAE